MVKCPPANARDGDVRDMSQSLSWEDSLEKGMATLSCILAWRIPWKRGLVGYSPWGRPESDMTKET